MDRITNLGSNLNVSRASVKKGEKKKQEASLPQDLVELKKKPLTEIMDQKQLRTFLKDIPKVDLHRHLEGSIEPETLISIAKRRNIKLPSYEPEKLKPYIAITRKDKTLLDFLKKFDTIGKAFADKDAIEEITYESIKDANNDNVKYMELRFSPVYMANQYNLKEDTVMKGVLDGVKKARKDFDTDIGLIMIVERQMGTKHAADVLKLAKKYMPQGVVAMDLANDEYNYPPGPYAEVFKEGKEAGLGITSHAGEAGGADNVRVSIEDLKADRIGHGNRTEEDPAVGKLVKEEGIFIEACPTSNVQTGAAESIAKHPIKRFYDDGYKVGINTDDPSVCDVTLTDEYQKVVTQFGFSAEDVGNFVMNGIDAAFLPKEEREMMKTRYKKKFDAVFSENAPRVK